MQQHLKLVCRIMQYKGFCLDTCTFPCIHIYPKMLINVIDARYYTCSILLPVPAPRCIEQPASQNGVISIQWSYVHTGGLNLTQVLVQSFNADVNGFELLENGNLTDLESSSFDAEGFTAGESYVFRILAFNDLGFGQADCPAVLHRIGEDGHFWKLLIIRINVCIYAYTYVLTFADALLIYTTYVI